MLDDQPFCTAECRLQACRTGKEGGGGGVGGNPLTFERPHLSRSSSALSAGSASSAGLYASFKAWM